MLFIAFFLKENSGNEFAREGGFGKHLKWRARSKSWISAGYPWAGLQKADKLKLTHLYQENSCSGVPGLLLYFKFLHYGNECLASRNFTFMGTLLWTRLQLVNNVFTKKEVICHYSKLDSSFKVSWAWETSLVPVVLVNWNME